MTYAKPRKIKGQVCHWVRWDPSGRIVEARYRPERVARAEAEPPVDVEPRRRGLLL